MPPVPEGKLRLTRPNVPASGSNNFLYNPFRLPLVGRTERLDIDERNERNVPRESGSTHVQLNTSIIDYRGKSKDPPVIMPSLRATSLNVRGVGGEPGFASLLGTAKTTRKKLRDVLLIQEHNLNPEKHQKYVDIAKLKGFTLVISYGRADDEESRRGGVLILTNDKTTSLHFVE